MAEVKVEVLAPLRQYVENTKLIKSEGQTVMDVLASLFEKYPKIKTQIFQSSNSLSSFVNIFVNGADVRELDGLATGLSQGDKIVVVAAIAGG